MTQSLEGKIAVVTGASKGIGLACAEALLKQGVTVVPVARDFKTLKAIFRRHGKRAIPVSADLLKEKDRLQLVPKILQRVPHIDIFHANAGAYVGGDLVKSDPKTIEDVITLNVNGVISPIRAVLPHMIERGKSGIVSDVVITSSIAGPRHPNYEPVYGPVKTAVDRFGELTRTQVGDLGVRVGLLQPGPTLTPLVDGWEPARREAAIKAQQFIMPEEVAQDLIYMVSQPPHAAVPVIMRTPKAFNLI